MTYDVIFEYEFGDNSHADLQTRFYDWTDGTGVICFNLPQFPPQNAWFTMDYIEKEEMRLVKVRRKKTLIHYVRYTFQFEHKAHQVMFKLTFGGAA